MRIQILLVGILIFLSISVFSQVPTLIYVQQVFRHGARYPIYPNSADGSNVAVTDKAVGQLTRQGKSMHYMLGDILYRSYWTKLFGITNNSYSQSKFYFKSTDVNRTIQSIQSQLMGLFENTNVLAISGVENNFSKPVWDVVPDRQPGDLFYNSPKFHSLPIHVQKGYYTPWTKGDFLRIYSPQFCYKQNDWMKANLRNPNIVKITSDPNFVAAIEALGNVIGKKLTFEDVYKYYDNAQCLKYLSIKPLPIFQGNTKVAGDLRAIAILDGYIKMFYTETQLRATSTGYFNETVNQFKRVTASQDGVQWAFYSAHDTTVMNFITRLGLTSVDCIYQNYLNGTVLNSQTKYCIVEYPTYTSTLIFEVYKYSNKNMFKIKYNGFLRLIPFCGWQQECAVEELYKWYDSWKDEDYPKTCGIKDSTSESYFSIMMIELAIIVVFAVAGVLSYFNKKKQPIVSESSNNSSAHVAGLVQPSHVENRIQDSLLSEDHV